MSRRIFHPGWAVAVVAVIAVAMAFTVAADERRPAPRQKAPAGIGHNEVVVAKDEDLRDQIRQCWNVPAMTRREDVNVHVIIELRPNGTVRDANVVDSPFSLGDPHRRAVAQSARHAVLSARCNPLRLPEGAARKSERITLTFNPSEIFGR